MQKSQTEKKLLKNLYKMSALESELQLIFPPKVFDAIEALARAHIVTNRYDSQSRELVSKLAFLLRQETFKRFGHESLETILLSKLLKPTHAGWRQPAPRMDSISFMRTYPRNQRLNSQEEGAAEMIKRVWEAFGKFRFIGGRNMDGGGGGGGQAKQPVDVMGDEFWEHYCKVYKPWYKKAAILSVNRRRYTLGSITLAAVAFKVLVEDFFPEEVDRGFGLTQGTCYRCLRVALMAYYEPEAFDAFADARKPVLDTRSAPEAPKPV